MFSDSFSIYIFFISIGLSFEPGLRALTRALLGPVNSLFQTEFTKVFSQSSLCWQKNLFFFPYCLCQCSFHKSFFGLFNFIPFSRIFTAFTAYYIWMFSSFVLFMYKAVVNRCMLKQYDSVLLVYIKFSYVCLLLLF